MEPVAAGLPEVELAVRPPYPPMEALGVDALPPGADFFEPKWDGFRCLAFRDGERVVLQFLRWRPDKAPRLCTFAQLEGGHDDSLAEFWGRSAG